MDKENCVSKFEVHLITDILSSLTMPKSHLLLHYILFYGIFSLLKSLFKITHIFFKEFTLIAVKGKLRYNCRKKSLLKETFYKHKQIYNTNKRGEMQNSYFYYYSIKPFI